MQASPPKAPVFAAARRSTTLRPCSNGLWRMIKKPPPAPLLHLPTSTKVLPRSRASSDLLSSCPSTNTWQSSCGRWPSARPEGLRPLRHRIARRASYRRDAGKPGATANRGRMAPETNRGRHTTRPSREHSRESVGLQDAAGVCLAVHRARDGSGKDENFPRWIKRVIPWRDITSHVKIDALAGSHPWQCDRPRAPAEPAPRHRGDQTHHRLRHDVDVQPFGARQD